MHELMKDHQTVEAHIWMSTHVHACCTINLCVLVDGSTWQCKHAPHIMFTVPDLGLIICHDDLGIIVYHVLRQSCISAASPARAKFTD